MVIDKWHKAIKDYSIGKISLKKFTLLMKQWHKANNKFVIKKSKKIKEENK